MKVVRFERTHCPMCDGMRHRVVRTRRVGVIVTRTHRCLDCGQAFMSHEPAGTRFIRRPR